LWGDGSNLYYADVVDPTVLRLLSPNGGEMFLAGKSIQITWQTEGPAPQYIKINYSADNGQNWNIVDTEAPNTGLYSWDSPLDLDSINCLIQISDPSESLINDTSDAVFTIFKCSSSLTADLNGDCLVDLEDLSLLVSQWLLCGNPYNPQWCFVIE
jgi:hypothetical protein